MTRSMTLDHYRAHCRAAVVDELLNILPRETALRLAVEAAPPFGLHALSRRGIGDRAAERLSVNGFIARLYFAFRYETPSEIEDIVVEVFRDLRRLGLPCMRRRRRVGASGRTPNALAPSVKKARMNLRYILLVGGLAASDAGYARPLENPSDGDGLGLSERAAVPVESHLPAHLGWFALGGLAAVVLLALFSAGEREPGGSGTVGALIGDSHAHDLFLQARLVRTSGGRSSDEKGKDGATAYLRDLDHRHATLVGSGPVARGGAVTITVQANETMAAASFRGRVVRCRRLGDDGAWYLLKLAIIRAAPNDEGVTRLLQLVSHHPIPVLT